MRGRFPFSANPWLMLVSMAIFVLLVLLGFWFVRSFVR